jgi:hypothetical protein
LIPRECGDMSKRKANQTGKKGRKEGRLEGTFSASLPSGERYR